MDDIVELVYNLTSTLTDIPITGKQTDCLLYLFGFLVALERGAANFFRWLSYLNAES